MSGDSNSGPIPEDELHNIADESSQSERRADEAERELMEWKKMKFMEQHIGEEYAGLIVSVTKFGMFVELNDMFIEGLVPLGSLIDDRYQYHENTRQIIGARNRKTYSMGDPIRVLVDRLDRMQHRIQFAVVEERPVRTKRRRSFDQAPFKFEVTAFASRSHYEVCHPERSRAFCGGVEGPAVRHWKQLFRAGSCPS